MVNRLCISQAHNRIQDLIIREPANISKQSTNLLLDLNECEVLPGSIHHQFLRYKIYPWSSDYPQGYYNIQTLEKKSDTNKT